MVCQNK